MFYLKYRPQTISDIDNTKVKEQFTLLLQNQKIPHALLFTGPKGTGKTSSARIIAKAINCQNNLFAQKSKSFEPCNTCDNCISITKGNSADVVEIDAASNRKIDEVRELIDKIKFMPIHSRYKVYIIDEIHMLTKESFNALLKTLEEPPKNTVFILATTEVDKLPKTVQSRCIQCVFPKASKADIIHMLSRITTGEKIKVAEPVLEFIANHSDNSFRDAAKIFEQVMLQENLTIDGVKNIIGLQLEKDDLLYLIEKNKLADILTVLQSYEDKGGDFKVLIEVHLQKLHQLLLQKNGIAIDTSETYNLSMLQITKLIKLFQEAYNLLKVSPIESLPLEVAIVEYFNQSKDFN